MEATKEKHATFTPGPWVVKHDKKGLPFIGVASDPWTYPGTVATVEDEKDARLIAQSPAMYEMCKLFEKHLRVEASMPWGFDEREMRDNLREVLAKVDGGEG